YREYSEVFFGSDYKVLKGGSWATHPTAVRATFRNWDYPVGGKKSPDFRWPGTRGRHGVRLPRLPRPAPRPRPPPPRPHAPPARPPSLERLLVEREHSLLEQAWAPGRQAHGTVNADGFGAGWYDLSVRAEPALYRWAGPMWADRSFASLAGLVRSAAVLAAV